MSYYEEEFEKLQEEFHEVIEHFPLFSEMIDEIYDKKIPVINEWLEKNDEYYLKKAISELKSLISYVKDMSTKISKEYDLFDEMAKTWEKTKLSNVSDDELKKINQDIDKANRLIVEHNLDSIMEANKIMRELLKKVK